MRSLIALRQVLELGCGALVIPEQVAVREAARRSTRRTISRTSARPSLLKAGAAAGRAGAGIRMSRPAELSPATG